MHTNRIRKIFHLGNTFFEKNYFYLRSFRRKG